MVIYHNVTIEKSGTKKFLNSVSLVIRMVLGLLKWLKESRFYERNTKIIIKTWTLHSTQELGRKKNLAQSFKKWESYISVLKKKTKTKNKKKQKKYIFFSTEHIVYWLLMIPFRERKIQSFLSPKVDVWWKVDGKMIFTDY